MALGPQESPPAIPYPRASGLSRIPSCVPRRPLLPEAGSAAPPTWGECTPRLSTHAHGPGPSPPQAAQAHGQRAKGTGTGPAAPVQFIGLVRCVERGQVPRGAGTSQSPVAPRQGPGHGGQLQSRLAPSEARPVQGPLGALRGRSAQREELLPAGGEGIQGAQ